MVLMKNNPIIQSLKANNMDLKGICSFDIESTGLNRYRDSVTSVQLGYDTKDGKIYYEFLTWEDFTLEVWTELLEFLKTKRVKILLHNGKFDLLFLYAKTGVLLDIFADTLVMAHVLGDRGYVLDKNGKKKDTGHALKGLVFKHYKDAYDIDTELKKGEITSTLIEYGIKDVMYPRKLYAKYKRELKAKGLVDTYKHELRAYRAFLRVETKGVYIDPDKDKAREYIKSKYLPLQEKLEEVARINWGSSQQVSSVLFSNFDTAIKGKPQKTTEWFIRDGKVKANGSLATSVFRTKGEAQKYVKSKGFVMSHFTYEKVVTTDEPILGFGLGLEPVKLTDKGEPSVDDDTLAKLLGKHEIIEVLREWKEWTKLESFIDSWEKVMTPDGYIHPSFNILARTGRTTCSNPNLQQCPQDPSIRNLIKAPPGKVIMEQDYSQLELRIVCALSKEPNMMQAYHLGKDLHAMTMELMFDGLDFDALSPAELKRKRTQAKSCFSGDTEILTRNGFVRFDMYDGYTEVAQYNKDTEVISYVKPNEFRMIPNTPICTYENDNVNLWLTPNHECLVTYETQGKDKQRVVDKLAYEELHKIPKHRKVMFINSGYVEYDESNYISEELTRFVAMFASDGSYSSWNQMMATLGFTKGRKIARCKELLEKAGIPYTIKKVGSAGVDTFCINDFETLCLLKRFVSKDKELMRTAIGYLDARVYLDEARHWDGHTQKKSTVTFSTVSELTANTMQEMAVTSGIRLRVSKSIGSTFTLSYNLNKSPYSRFLPEQCGTKTNGHSNHNVFCVSVPDSNIVIRRCGKVSIQGNCNFGFVYGLQARSFVDYAKGYGLNLTLEEAEDFRNRFLKAYSALPVWWKDMVNQARDYGYAKTLTNRKRFLPDIWSYNFKDRSAAERQAINTPVQGLGSDICISALSDIVFSTELDHSKFRIMGSVHDAILYEVDEDYAEELSVKTREIMEYPSLLRDLNIDLGVPLVVDTEISHAWGGH